MHADLESIFCKFGGDLAICLREEAICAKVYRRTDGGRRAIALAHSWNELKIMQDIMVAYFLWTTLYRRSTSSTCIILHVDFLQLNKG